MVLGMGPADLIASSGSPLPRLPLGVPGLPSRQSSACVIWWVPTSKPCTCLMFCFLLWMLHAYLSVCLSYCVSYGQLSTAARVSIPACCLYAMITLLMLQRDRRQFSLQDLLVLQTWLDAQHLIAYGVHALQLLDINALKVHTYNLHMGFQNYFCRAQCAIADLQSATIDHSAKNPPVSL